MAARERYRIALVGAPNVGKSLAFQRLTGAYAVVSNYPGTTVEVTRAAARRLSGSAGPATVIDTPGMYSLLPISDEERVARRILLSERPDLVVQVIDAKNLERMLPLTFQLLEAGLPLVLAVNMLDEAARAGLAVDLAKLSALVGVPAVGTVGTTGQGFSKLKKVIASQLHVGQDGQTKTANGDENPEVRVFPETHVFPEARVFPEHNNAVTNAIARVEKLLSTEYGFSRRSLALLACRGDDDVVDFIMRQEPPAAAKRIKGAIAAASRGIAAGEFTQAYHDAARKVASICVSSTGPRRALSVSTALGRLTSHPVWGVPLMLAVLYYFLFKFVGQFGAGTLVDYLENEVFLRYFNPFVSGLVSSVIPWPALRELFVGEYGLITLGLRYAMAIVLPVVGTFFLAFAILEDSGYLPRLAMLADAWFSRVGLNGRAVIPIVLGFGCGTMATMVTRILETKRERLIATFLLAFAIPCSAQLGLIAAMLTAYPIALLIWGVTVASAFVGAGSLLSRYLPGRRPSFYMELPPLRLPHPGNVLRKSYTRLEWYFMEVLPLFLWASVIIWAGRLTGLFDLLIAGVTPVVRLLGLPDQTAVIMLFGFFRRDYGAAGLYDLVNTGALSTCGLLVAATTLTLFTPCVAQFAMMWKERGPRFTLAATGAILVLALGTGFLLNTVLTLTSLLE